MWPFQARYRNFENNKNIFWRHKWIAPFLFEKQKSSGLLIVKRLNAKLCVEHVFFSVLKFLFLVYTRSTTYRVINNEFVFLSVTSRNILFIPWDLANFVLKLLRPKKVKRQILKISYDTIKRSRIKRDCRKMLTLSSFLMFQIYCFGPGEFFRYLFEFGINTFNRSF